MHIGGGPSRGLGRAAGGLAAESRHLHHGEKTPSVRPRRPADVAELPFIPSPECVSGLLA